MKKLKVAIIGSGSTYTPELIEGFINKKDCLDVGKLYLMDIAKEKNQIVGSFVKRMLAHAYMETDVIITDDLTESLQGADYVLCQVRVGGLSARILDEKIPLKYDLLGQETTGIGGFFKALRTIPVLENVAQIMLEVCPKAWLINFSNPSGLIAETILNRYNINMIGLCNAPINMVDNVKTNMHMPDAQVEYIGLNHLSWITAIRNGGKNHIDQALSEGISTGTLQNIKGNEFETELLKIVRGLPSSYLQYYYHRRHKIEMLKKENKCRGEVCMEIEKRLLGLYNDPHLYEKPEELNKRGGHRYSEAAVALIDAIENDRNLPHAVNVKNNGTVDFMADSDVIETTFIIGKTGAKTIKIEGFDNPHIVSLMQIVKAYEKYTAVAAVSGDDEMALRALMSHPLLGDYDSVNACYKELKSLHKQYLGNFYKQRQL